MLGGTAGTFGSPVALIEYGGTNVGSGLGAFSQAMHMMSTLTNLGASMSSTLGSYQRRFDEWKLQERQSAKEMEQIDKQVLAAQIRLSIAERELENHDLQIENAKEVDAFMRDKFTNKDLYDWTVSRISSIYFQSYQMAYDVAKRAEKAYQFELGATASTFVQFGHWDSLKKGLLAGEKLSYDLKRMEVSYLENNRREYELTKHISLAMLDPVALIKLKQTGQCFIKLPEMLFDLDHPGHYMRRIKSVSLTIPCVTGPYTSVNCTLTLLSNSVRKNSLLLNGKYERSIDTDDPRFADNVAAIQSIVTSGAQNDGGVFDLNLRDERYLPCEGAGVISDWRIELPQASNHFDLNTVSDLVLHMRFTAREGGELLKTKANQAIKDAFKTPPAQGEAPGLKLVRMFSAKHEFPIEWYQFLHPASADTVQSLKVHLKGERFLYHSQEEILKIYELSLYLKLKPGHDYSNNTQLKVRVWTADALAEAANEANPTLPPPSAFEEIESISGTVPDQIENYLPKNTPISNAAENIGEWRIEAHASDHLVDAPWLKSVDGHNQLDPEAIEDIIMVFGYWLQSPP
jgi:phage anti-repressor protein